MTQPTNTMKTLTLQVTDEQAEQIQKMLGENELPFRPKYGDWAYRLWADGGITRGIFLNGLVPSELDHISQNNIFPTREAAEMAKLRREILQTERQKAVATLEEVLESEYQKRNPPNQDNMLRNYAFDIMKSFNEKMFL